MARIHEFPENLYAILGVEPGADDDTIRRAGRRRQRESHPDLGGSAEEFTRVRLALEVLSDPRHRAEHDAWLATTHGIVAPSRPGTVRLRRQRRPASETPAPKARTPRSPAQPAARHAAAGSDESPAARIPDQHVDVRRFAWFRRAWEPARVWPGDQPGVPPVSAREALMVAPLLIVGLVSVVLLAIPASPISTPWWPVAAALVGLSTVWILLRAQAERAALARTLVIATIAGLGLSGAFAFLDSSVGITPGRDDPMFAHALRGTLALVTCGLTLVAWAGLRPRNRRVDLERLLMRLADESAPPADSTEQVFGEPGMTAMQHSAPGVNRVRRKLAEERVGAELAALARIPGVRIIHGLRLPGGDESISTISHAVLTGRRLAIIDAELRRPGRYAVDPRGAVTRDLVPVPGTTEFPHRVERLHEYFGDVAEVRGWLTIVPESAGEFGVDNARTWARVRLATTETLLREAGDWLAEDGERVDRLLLRDVLDLRVEP